MAVLMILELDGTTTDDYDAVNEAMGIDEDNLPDGLVQHAVGPTEDGDGLLIVDVWESEEQLEHFVQNRLGPATAQVGIQSQAQPRVHPVHNHFQGSGTEGNVIILIESPGFGPEHYDEVTSNMDAHEADGSGHPAVSHVAAITDDGMVFVDVWHSGEAAGKFVEEQVGPAAASAGHDLSDSKTRVVPVHNRFAPAATAAES
jgi:heme-degrading monooxygenase HmoA